MNLVLLLVGEGGNINPPSPDLDQMTK